MAQRLQNVDQQVTATLNTIQGFISKMENDARTVRAIQDEIGTHYQAASSTKFCSRLQDWLDTYQSVITQYGEFHDKVLAAARQVSRGEEHAQLQA